MLSDTELSKLSLNELRLRREAVRDEIEWSELMGYREPGEQELAYLINLTKWIEVKSNESD